LLLGKPSEGGCTVFQTKSWGGGEKAKAGLERFEDNEGRGKKKSHQQVESASLKKEKEVLEQRVHERRTKILKTVTCHSSAEKERSAN